MFNELSKYGNEIALIGEKNEKITYKRLVSESDKIKKNIKKNSLVLLICKNSVESIIGYVSFLKNDHITILADANFEKKYLIRLVNIYKPRYIFSQRNYGNKLGQFGWNFQLGFPDKNQDLENSTKFFQCLKITLV